METVRIAPSSSDDGSTGYRWNNLTVGRLVVFIKQSLVGEGLKKVVTSASTNQQLQDKLLAEQVNIGLISALLLTIVVRFVLAFRGWTKGNDYLSEETYDYVFLVLSSMSLALVALSTVSSVAMRLVLSGMPPLQVAHFVDRVGFHIRSASFDCFIYGIFLFLFAILWWAFGSLRLELFLGVLAFPAVAISYFFYTLGAVEFHRSEVKAFVDHERRNPRLWTVQEVCAWASRHGVEDVRAVAAVLRREDIDGRALHVLHSRSGTGLEAIGNLEDTPAMSIGAKLRLTAALDQLFQSK